MENRVITILGTTATGKGTVARSIARVLQGEILSIDSMKVYRGMDIGTAKPSLEDRASLPHHLIDVAEPCESFSVARFVERATAAIDQIHARGRPVIAVGGTVLYFKGLYEGLFEGPGADPALREELRRRAAAEGTAALHAELTRVDPESAARIHPKDLRRIERALEVFHLSGRPISQLQRQWTGGPQRADWQWTLIGLQRSRETGNRRINARVKRMVAQGLVDEARRLYEDPRGIGAQARQAVGYAEFFAHFEGKWPLEYAVERVKINSRHLAKHQRTWLKRFPGITWIDQDALPSDEAAAEAALAYLADARATESPE